jgi:hypothetical protein
MSMSMAAQQQSKINKKKYLTGRKWRTGEQKTQSNIPASLRVSGGSIAR